MAEGVGETGYPVHLESLCSAWTPDVTAAYLRTKAAFGCVQWEAGDQDREGRNMEAERVYATDGTQVHVVPFVAAESVGGRLQVPALCGAAPTDERTGWRQWSRVGIAGEACQACTAQ
jgi:hypothetical protein